MLHIYIYILNAFAEAKNVGVKIENIMLYYHENKNLKRQNPRLYFAFAGGFRSHKRISFKAYFVCSIRYLKIIRGNCVLMIDLDHMRIFIQDLFCL